MIIEITGLNVNAKQLEAIRQAIKARYTPQKVKQLNEQIREANQLNPKLQSFIDSL